MKVGIVGAGAMGCLFAAKLAKSRNEVLLVDRDVHTVAAIARVGVRIKEGRKVRRFAVRTRKAPTDFASFDVVLVMVKAYDTPTVANELRERIGENTTVLTLQNGLNNLETLSYRLGRRVLGGSTTEASLRLGSGFVEHTGRGRTLVGETNGSRSRRVLELVQLFNKAGFRSFPTDHVREVVWSKAVLNCAINPVSALTRLQNGDLAKSTSLKSLMTGVLSEGSRVAESEQVKLRSNSLVGILSRVLRSSSQNRSSMLQDVLNGRKTEVRELNGMISRLGRKHHLATPLNDALGSLVMSLERSYS